MALIIPGWMVAWGLGIQGALRLVTAPALSLGVWAAVTWIAIGLHLPWRVWLVSPLMGLVLLPFVLGRLLTLRPGAKARWPQVPQTRLTRGWWLVGWICVFISGLPYLVATRAGGRVAQTWDVVFHLSAIRYTRERASASPWVAFAPLYNGEEIYYPNIFHNIVSLLPGSPVTVYTAITLVFLGLWPLMIGVFTLLTVVSLRGSTPDSYFMSGLAMLGAAMGINFPTLAVANYATPPYNLSLVATPGVIILGLMIYRLRPQPGLGLGGALRVVANRVGQAYAILRVLTPVLAILAIPAILAPSGISRRVSSILSPLGTAGTRCYPKLSIPHSSSPGSV